MESKQVDAKHSAYLTNEPSLDRFTAVMGGTPKLRAGKTKYLPQFEAESDDAYKLRVSLGLIDGLVAGGVTSLAGKVFAGPVDVSKVNPSISPLLENIDNQGNNFDVFSRRAFEAAFDGHSVIIVDAPKAESPVTSFGDEQRQGIRPYWRLYKAKDVTNWRWAVDPITKKTKLAMLVLRECSEEPDGQFGSKEVERYRVYRDNDGVVTQELWKKKAEGDGDRTNGQRYMMEWRISLPKSSAIPAAIIGELDYCPWLINETELELLSYFKVSNYNIIERMTVPIFATKGYDESNGKIELGAETHLKLPAEAAADVFYVQIDASGHDTLKATIAELKQTISGQLDYITKQAMTGPEETATEVVSDDSKSQARLVVWAGQLKDALELALQFTAEFMGLGEDKGGEVKLMTAWDMAKEAAQQQKDADSRIITDEMELKRTEVEAKAKALLAKGK